jgi:hypothetical protein
MMKDSQVCAFDCALRKSANGHYPGLARQPLTRLAQKKLAIRERHAQTFLMPYKM